MKGFCQRLRESRFSHARNVFDQQVTARQQGNERKLNSLFFAEDNARDGAMQLRNYLRGGGRHS